MISGKFNYKKKVQWVMGIQLAFTDGAWQSKLLISAVQWDPYDDSLAGSSLARQILWLRLVALLPNGTRLFSL